MRFSKFKYEELKVIRARANAHDAEFRRKARIALLRLSPAARTIAQFDGLVGGTADFVDMRKATAANGQARTLLRKRLIKAVRRVWRTTRSIEFYFGTIIHADWHTKSCDTVLNLADMQDRVRTRFAYANSRVAS